MVKAALKAAGINAHVGHGTGTAWGWLDIYVGSAEQFGPHTTDEMGSHANCAPCKRIHAIAEQAHKIAAEVTGRAGMYQEDISVNTSRYWNGKQAVEIIQNQDVDTKSTPLISRETRREIRLNKVARRYANRVRRGDKTVSYL